MVATLKGRDVLRITDMSSQEISALLNLSAELKAGNLNPSCNKVLGLLFYKASTRTRVSFTVAMYQLGGQVIDLNPSVTQVGRGEPLADTARVLDRYLDILAVRTFKQEDLEAFANYTATACSGSGLAEICHSVLHELLGQPAHVAFTCEKARFKRDFRKATSKPFFSRAPCVY
ncbi:MAG: hypothetical protein ACKO1G_04495, partial [Microcystis aeruginosa]